MPNTLGMSDSVKATTISVYNAIIRHKQLHQGNSPDYRAIEDAVGMSTGQAKEHIQILVALGWIVKPPRKARSITIPGAIWISPKQREKLEERLKNAGIPWQDIW